MPRQNKKSRMKFLPPKIQLDERMAATGSYPTVSRPSVDGRTGNYSVSFDDTKTLLFVPYSNIQYGVGLPSSSLYFSANTSLRQNETATQFSGSGNLVKGIGDATPMVHFTPGQDGGPFRDNDQYAVDGKSSNSDFYSTGTSIQVTGEEGYDVPLWSKDKIEIDISCNSTTEQTVYMGRPDMDPYDNLTWEVIGSSYNMSYYNFAAKKWEGIGIGRWFRTGNNEFVASYNTVGFPSGLINLGIAATPEVRNLKILDGYYFGQNNSARVSDVYGFPFDGRYHATSSQTFSMQSLIDRPFIVEKIVVEMSATFAFDSNIQNGTCQFGSPLEFELTSSILPAAINNIFILNQRTNARINYYNDLYPPDQLERGDIGVITSSLPRNVKLTDPSGTDTYVNTIRDIVSYGAITAFASNMPTSAPTSIPGVPSPYNPKQLLSRECVIETSVPLSKSLNALNWNKEIKIEMTTKCPSQLPRCIRDCEYYNRMEGGAYGGGNNGLGVLYPSGRNIANFVKKAYIIETDSGYRTVDGDFDSKTPYVLFPEDNLIIGWQQPAPEEAEYSSLYPNDFTWYTSTTGVGAGGSVPGTGRLCSVTFPQGPAKLVLYGSYLSEGKPKNDSLNQLLSSDSVHEVIGED